MQSRTKNLSFTRDAETGIISATGEAKTKEEKYMMGIINDKNITVNICAENDYETQEGDVHAGGAFMGNDVIKGAPVNAYQDVNPTALAGFDKETNAGSGNFMWHEIAEGYEGGRSSAKTGVSAKKALEKIKNSAYDNAHYKAGKYFPGTIFDSSRPIILPDMNGGTRTIYKKSSELRRK